MASSRRPRARLRALVALSLTLVVLGQVPNAWGGSGHIITVAGSGAPGFDGDGGPATSAQLRDPSSVVIDSAGNLFIADTINNRVRHVAAGSGIITTVAGTGIPGFSGDAGPATSAQLNYPTSVAIDTAGNLFIVDTTNSRIRKVTANTGIITTVAGTGVPGFSGDDGPATSAQLNYPTSVAVDTAGALFIADQSNLRIRRVAASTGIITTVAGTGVPGFSGDGGPATSAQLNYPTSVAVDTAGHLFIADQSNLRIRRVAAATGIITTVAGTGIPGFSGDDGQATDAKLNFPYYVVVDAAGSLFIVDTGNSRIRKVTATTGIITTIAGTGAPGFSGDDGPATSAQLWTPTGIAVDAAGNLFIADAGDHRIRRVAAGTGIITTVAGTGTAGFFGDGGPATGAQLWTPTGIAVDAAGNLFIADADNNRIRQVAARTGIITTVAGTGIAGFSGDGGPATSAQLSTPTGIAVDAAGNLLIADANNDRIRRVAADTGIISTVAGTGAAGFSGDDGQAADAELNFPYYVALDAGNNVFIADQGNLRIRRVAAGTGIISTVAGTGHAGFSGDGGPATSAQLSVPYGVAVEATGNLFIADQGNFRVRQVAAGTGVITTVAGTGIPGFSGDGGPATSAQLNVSYGVALDVVGNLFIADTGNNRIRAVDLAVAVPPPVITSGPINPTDDTSATFTFVGAQPGVVRFSCQLDAGGFMPCVSPQRYSGPLAFGEHTFQVKATNQFGDTSAPSRYTWTTTTPVFTLTVGKQGTGSGRVASSPSGISCGATCASNYLSGTLVTLTAMPDAGSVFIGWSGGGCSGAGICTVTIVATTAVTANFSGLFALTVTRAGSGTGTVVSSPVGITCGETCSARFVSGAVVTLTAAPGGGSLFVGWSGGGCSGTAPCVVTVSAATTVTATFASAFVLTVATAGAGAGTVTSTPAIVSCGAICSATFGSGTVVTLTAVPDGGSAFVGWSGGGCSGTADCTVTLVGTTVVTATFNVTGPFTFTDPNLVGGLSVIKAVHVEELRNAINKARTARRLDAISFTDPSLIVGSTTVKAAHIAELRTALTEAYAAVRAPAPTYTDATLGIGTTVVRAIHIRELRSAVQTLP